MKILTWAVVAVVFFGLGGLATALVLRSRSGASAPVAAPSRGSDTPAPTTPAGPDADSVSAAPVRPPVIPASALCRVCARPIGTERSAHVGCQELPESRNDWPDGSRQVSCLDCGRPFQSVSKAQRLCHACRVGRGPSGR